MRVDRRLPELCEVFKHADVVEVTVRQDDGRRTGVGAEPLLCRPGDEPHRAEHAGVDQHRVAVARMRPAVEGHVDDAEPPVGQVRRDLARAVIPCRVGFRIVGAG